MANEGFGIQLCRRTQSILYNPTRYRIFEEYQNQRTNVGIGSLRQRIFSVCSNGSAFFASVTSSRLNPKFRDGSTKQRLRFLRTLLLLLVPSLALGQTPTLNLSTDLVQLGITSANLVPNQPALD